MSEPFAVLGGRLAVGLRDVTDDVTALDSRGLWAVVQTFEGPAVCARFERLAPLPAARPWQGPPHSAWESSLDRAAYEKGVVTIREAIADGVVYQANLCRVLTAPSPQPPDMLGLHRALDAGNPAPYSAVVDVPGAHVVSASPELFLRRGGRRVESRPIKGTGRVAADLTPKDQAENVMIVDLVRNDLARVAEIGSVEVRALCEVEEHPGLVHLVSTVTAELVDGAGWAELLEAAAPPGSVSGAPKSSALQVIAALEPVPRRAYCGAVGWVDADRREGALAVGIRTFEWYDGTLALGTGAGITWGSDPAREWEETELKVERLLSVVSS